MRAGGLSRQITIERKSVTLDPVFGTEIISWVPLVAAPGSPVVGVRFYANVMDVLPSKSEAFAQGLVIGRSQTRVRLRWRDDIDSSMRIVVHEDSDRLLQIVGGPAMLGRKEGLELLCEAFTTPSAGG